MTDRSTPTIANLIDAISEIPVTLQADLETGSHHFNNAASEEFSKRYKWLSQQLRIVQQLAIQIESLDFKPRRMWVNQPSTSQLLHHMHGAKVLAIDEYEGMCRIYPLSGVFISMHAPKSALSPGWPE